MSERGKEEYYFVCILRYYSSSSEHNEVEYFLGEDIH